MLEFDYRMATLVDLEVRGTSLRLDLRMHEAVADVTFRSVAWLGRLRSGFEQLRGRCRSSGGVRLYDGILVTRAGRRGMFQARFRANELWYRLEYRSVDESLASSQRADGRGDGPLPRLVTPHRCMQCRAVLRSPDTGKRFVVNGSRTTGRCATCGNTTSAFATRHVCLSCGRLLESPSSTAGLPFACPECSVSGEVPEELLHRPDDPARPTGEAFIVECESCNERWHALVNDVGRWTVCRSCHVPFPVPRVGTSVDGQQSVHVDSESRCTTCRGLFPVAAEHCPFCGAPDGTE